MLKQIKPAYATFLRSRMFSSPRPLQRAAKDQEKAGIFSGISTSNIHACGWPRAEAVQGDHVGDGTDVLVIGGGLAGLATAIAARMKGFDVTVADGATPPIDKACGEGLLPGSLAALRELGVVIGPGDGRVFPGIRFIEGTTSVEASFSGAGGFCCRRNILPHKMVQLSQH